MLTCEFELIDDSEYDIKENDPNYDEIIEIDINEFERKCNRCKKKYYYPFVDYVKCLNMCENCLSFIVKDYNKIKSKNKK